MIIETAATRQTVIEKIQAIELTVVIAAMRALAAASPTNKYGPGVTNGTAGPDHRQPCFYDKGDCTNGSKGCIVGQAWVKCGITLEELATASLGAVTDVYDCNAELPEYRLQANWIRTAQNSQDDGFAWGECITRANDFWPGV